MNEKRRKGITRSMKLLEERVKAGDHFAAYALAKQILAIKPRPSISDIRRANKLLLIAMKRNVRDAAYELGQQYDEFGFFGNDTGRALRWYIKAAALGHPSACNAAGFHFEHNAGKKRDMHRAVRYYLKGAQLGDMIAQFNLGKSYEDGTGVSKSERLAKRWYSASAAQGYQDARYRLRKLKKKG